MKELDMENRLASRKILALRAQIYTIKDKRLIDDKLKEIQREVVALEVQHAELTRANFALVHAANSDSIDVEVPF